MKPITYWLQNDAINELVDLYGSQLGRLTEADRRELIACLALGPDLHSWGSTWDEAYRLTKDLTGTRKTNSLRRSPLPSCITAIPG